MTVAPTIVDASLISEWIAARNGRVDEQVPVVDGHEQWIDVEISGDTYNYQVMVMATRDRVALEPIGKRTRCECTNEQLLEFVDKRIATAIEQLQIAAARAQEPDPESEGPEYPTPELERRVISRVGIGGIVTTALGAGLVGGGLVMILKEASPVHGFYSIKRNLKPPGGAALAAGGAALVAGVSMMVVDVIQCRRVEAPRRCERRGRRTKQLTLDVGPSFEANGGGLTIFGRF